jgi:hypothetical protein
MQQNKALNNMLRVAGNPNAGYHLIDFKLFDVGFQSSNKVFQTAFRNKCITQLSRFALQLCSSAFHV